MTEPISTSPLGNDPINSNESDFVAQLGRISGKLLSANLLRNGVDLAFDTDLLFLQVTDKKIGINQDSPVYTLDVLGTSNIPTVLSNSATIDNIVFESSSRITTVTGEINITPTGLNPTAIFDKLQAGNIVFNDNIIKNTSLNANLIFDPSGTGKVLLEDNTLIDNNLTVSGNITINGDLSTNSNIILGDSPLDDITLQPKIKQDLNPGDDLTYDLGAPGIRWRSAHIPDWTQINNIRPDRANINNTLFLGGANNSVTPLTTNTNLEINPSQNQITIEDIKFDQDSIINLLNTPLTLRTTGIGYYRFSGTTAMQIPAGTSLERPLNPERGDTRWNTELGYLECFDGTVYITSIGPGDTLDVQDMEDLGNIYTLILG